MPPSLGRRPFPKKRLLAASGGVEKRKAGDYEDFSFWTWRQLLMTEYDARVVFGKHGRYGIGHAWVTFQGNRCFLIEPQAATLGLKLPRLSTLGYEPEFSVTWNGQVLRYYAHKSDTEFRAPLKLAIRLLPEWLNIWSRFWLKFAVRFPHAMAGKVRGVGRRTGGRIERL